MKKVRVQRVEGLHMVEVGVLLSQRRLEDDSH